MKLAFAIATVIALQQAVVTRADCDFGSNYTSSFNSSGYCSFDFGFGAIQSNSSESTTISSGDTNVTTYTARGNKVALWKMGNKNSTVQCYPDVSGKTVATSYPNGSTFTVYTGDFAYRLNEGTVADGVSFSIPGLYYIKGGRVEVWADKDETGSDYYTTIKA